MSVRRLPGGSGCVIRRLPYGKGGPYCQETLHGATFAEAKCEHASALEHKERARDRSTLKVAGTEEAGV